MDEQALRDTMDSICVAAADAVRSYSEIAVIDPTVGNMHEHFVPSIVFEKVGRQLAKKGIGLRLEVPTLKLREYNAATQAGFAGSAIPVVEQGSNKASAPLSTGIVDMVVFEHKISSKPLRVLALVEFKHGLGPRLLRDRGKLLRILSEIDTCKWGIFCGMVGGDGADLRFLEQEEKDALTRHDIWCRKPVDLPSVAGKRPAYAVCAVGFTRSSP